MLLNQQQGLYTRGGCTPGCFAGDCLCWCHKMFLFASYVQCNRIGKITRGHLAFAVKYGGYTRGDVHQQTSQYFLVSGVFMSKREFNFIA